MKPLLSCEASGALDRLAASVLSLDELQLMESASLALWRKFIEFEPRAGIARITAFCGKGNNGGDGLAFMRHAAIARSRLTAGDFSLPAEERAPTVRVESGRAAEAIGLVAIVSDRDLSGPCRRQLESARAAGVRILGWNDIGEIELKQLAENSDWLVDAVCGTGLAGAARGEAASMIESFARVREWNPDLNVAAIDLPSGLGDSWSPGFPLVRADITLALEPRSCTLYYPGARTGCGKILPVDGVFSAFMYDDLATAFLLEASDAGAGIPRARDDDYKTLRGKLELCAGSPATPGAAVLAARAAQASGAGYVTLHADALLVGTYADAMPSIVLKDIAGLDPRTERFDAALAGPGWGKSDRRRGILAVLAASGSPLVLDADALGMLDPCEAGREGSRHPWLLTPHPGEFDALSRKISETDPATGDQNLNFPGQLAFTAERYGSVLLYKSNVSWIVGQGFLPLVWDGSTPEIGMAGSGDVLAGLAAGFAAGLGARVGEHERRPGRSGTRQQSPASESGTGLLFRAAASAVVIHGEAGRRLAARMGWFTPEDLIRECAFLVRKVDRDRRSSGGNSEEIGLTGKGACG